MTLAEFINRARDRGLELVSSRVGGYVSLELDGQWVPVTGLTEDEPLGADTRLYLCEYLGLDPIDFEL